MRIGAAIIEAGPNKFSDYDWGEELVTAVNGFLDPSQHISVDSTGYELEDVLKKLGKHAKRAIEKYPISGYTNGESSTGIVLRLFKIVGTKNGIIILASIFFTFLAIGLGLFEASFYGKEGTGIGGDFFLRVLEIFVGGLTGE